MGMGSPRLARGEVTDQELIAARAHEVARRIVEGRRAIDTAGVMLGGLLHEFFEERMHEPLGYASQEEFLASPEVEIAPGTAKRMMRVYRGLVLERGVSPEELAGLGYTKLDVVLPALKAGSASWEDARADVEALGKEDLVSRYRGGERAAGFDAESEPALCKCGVCGKVHRPKAAS